MKLKIIWNDNMIAPCIVLRILNCAWKSRNQAKTLARIPRTRYCFSINKPGTMVFSSSASTMNQYHIFYRINLVNKSSPLNWVSKKTTWRENGYSQKRVRSPLLEECKLWPWKQRAELFVSMSSKIAWFLYKLYINCFVHSRLSTNQVIFKCYFKNPCFQLPQKLPWTDEMMRVIGARSSVL